MKHFTNPRNTMIVAMVLVLILGFTLWNELTLEE